MARLFEFQSDELSHDRMTCDRTAERFPAIDAAHTFRGDFHERSQLRSRFDQDFLRRFCRIHRDDFGKQGCDLRYSNLTRGPCPNDFGGGFQSQTRSDAFAEFRRISLVDGTERSADRFTANPEAAAFVTKIGTPATDAKHRAILVAADND